MKYFRSYRDAVAYCKNNELGGKPQKAKVWLDMQWQEVWAVKLPEELLCKP